MVTFTIRLGFPSVQELWDDLETRFGEGKLNSNEREFYKKWGKAMSNLSMNPRHPGLQSHEIDILTKKYGVKVFQSYLENNTPAAGRMFWIYPEKMSQTIVVVGVEPHPNKKSSYDQLHLETALKSSEPESKTLGDNRKK